MTEQELDTIEDLRKGVRNDCWGVQSDKLVQLTEVIVPALIAEVRRLNDIIALRSNLNNSLTDEPAAGESSQRTTTNGLPLEEEEQ